MYNTVRAMSVGLLKQLLSAMEEISMSPLALRGLVERGKREASKEQLVRLIEFCTNVDGDTPIDGMMRHVPTLIKEFKALNDVTRRARDMKMPPDWISQGLYQLEQSGCDHELFVRHRFTQLRGKSSTPSLVGDCICRGLHHRTELVGEKRRRRLRPAVGHINCMS